jgi:hypothetical protein
MLSEHRAGGRGDWRVTAKSDDSLLVIHSGRLMWDNQSFM